MKNKAETKRLFKKVTFIAYRTWGGVGGEVALSKVQFQPRWSC